MNFFTNAYLVRHLNMHVDNFSQFNQLLLVTFLKLGEPLASPSKYAKNLPAKSFPDLSTTWSSFRPTDHNLRIQSWLG